MSVGWAKAPLRRAHHDRFGRRSNGGHAMARAFAQSWLCPPYELLSAGISQPQPLFQQSANRLSLRLRQPLGEAMDDDKSMLQTATDAVNSAASATTDAAKTAVKKVKK